MSSTITKSQSQEGENPNQQIILVLPVYNEQDCITKVLSEWCQTLKKLRCKMTIIVINDGSTDQTLQILNNFSPALQLEESELKIINIKNSGHGEAIMLGYNEALKISEKNDGTSFIFQTDSDDQFNPSDFLKLWNKRENYAFIFGHRKKRLDSLTRLAISKVLTCILNLFFSVEVIDANIPFRLMNALYLRKILPQIPAHTFAPNIFITLLALGQYKTETLQGIEIEHKKRNTGKVSIVSFKLIKVCITSFKQLLKFKFSFLFVRWNVSKIF